MLNSCQHQLKRFFRLKPKKLRKARAKTRSVLIDYGGLVMKHINNNSSYRSSGFVLVEALVMFAIIGLLAAIVVPPFYRELQATKTNICVNNLRKVELAKTTFAQENRTNNRVWSMENLFSTKQPICPSGGKYTIGKPDEEAFCSRPKHTPPGSLGVLKPKVTTVGNSSFVDIGKNAEEEGTKILVLKSINWFENSHPDLRLTGQQVMYDYHGMILGVFLRHEPRTNAAITPELSTH